MIDSRMKKTRVMISPCFDSPPLGGGMAGTFRSEGLREGRSGEGDGKDGPARSAWRLPGNLPLKCKGFAKGVSTDLAGRAGQGQGGGPETPAGAVRARLRAVSVVSAAAGEGGGQAALGGLPGGGKRGGPFFAIFYLTPLLVKRRVRRAFPSPPPSTPGFAKIIPDRELCRLPPLQGAEKPVKTGEDRARRGETADAPAGPGPGAAPGLTGSRRRGIPLPAVMGKPGVSEGRGRWSRRCRGRRWCAATSTTASGLGCRRCACAGARRRSGAGSCPTASAWSGR